jgi:predicted acetyltransferase
MIEIIKTDLLEISQLRQDYLNSLPEFQELYMELLVEEALIYKIISDDSLAGYAAKTKGDILVELFIKNNYIPISSLIFQQIIHDLTIRSIYCKSFDHVLLNCCLMGNYSYKLIGSLFREYIETAKVPIGDLNVQTASEKDYSFLLQQEGELYETPEELRKYVDGNNIILFQKENELLGCGYLIKIHSGFDYYDIGMWVNPSFRKQGIATLIISYLKDKCLTNHWKPICGCAIDNIASQKTLERNGFLCKHKLIEFIIS